MEDIGKTKSLIAQQPWGVFKTLGILFIFCSLSLHGTHTAQELIKI